MSTSDIDKLWSGKTKIIPVWKLKIQVEPMITIGEKMFSAEKYSEFAHGMKSAQDLNFEILYDNKIVGCLTFPDNQTQQLTKIGRAHV